MRQGIEFVLRAYREKFNVPEEHVVVLKKVSDSITGVPAERFVICGPFSHIDYPTGNI